MTLYEDEYNYFLGELMEQPDEPYTMANEELATAFFDKMLQDDQFQEASMHNYFTTQYICLNNRARHALLRRINAQKQRQREELNATYNLINEVTERAKHGNNSNH